MADGGTFSFMGPSEAGVFADPVSEVRFLIKDTAQGEFSMTDEEIQYLLNLNGGSTLAAAAAAAEDRAGQYAAAAKKQIDVGPFKITKDYTKAVDTMRALADDLRNGLAAAPVVAGTADDGGQSVFSVGMASGPPYSLPGGAPWTNRTWG